MSISRTTTMTIGAVLLSHQLILASVKCDSSTLRENFNTSNAVFSGEVLGVKQTGDFFEVQVRVLKSWKRVRTPEITVFTYPVSAETPNFVKGRRYLVFAHIFQGKLVAAGCSGTVALEYAHDQLRQLEGQSRRKGGKK